MIDNTTPGLLAVRYLKSLAIGGTDALAAAAFAQANDAWPAEHKRQIVERVKSGVSGISTVDIGGGSYIASDFQAALRPLTIMGELSAAARATAHQDVDCKLLARWRRGPATAQAGCRWSAPARAQPCRSFPSGAMSVATNELLRDNSFEAETEVLAELLASCQQMQDHKFHRL